MAKELPAVAWKDVTVNQLCESYVKKQTQKRQCSYVELVADGPQVPHFCVDFSTLIPFHEIMLSVEWLAEV